MRAALAADFGELQSREIRPSNRVVRFYRLNYIPQARLFNALPEILGWLRSSLVPQLSLSRKIGFHIRLGFEMRFAFHYFFSFPPA